MLRTAVLVVRRMILGSWSGSSMAKVVSETAMVMRVGQVETGWTGRTAIPSLDRLTNGRPQVPHAAASRPQGPLDLVAPSNTQCL
jgi:hypothetical protein